MHDEFERAISGDTRKRGLSPVGWVFLAMGFFALAGTLGAGFVAYKVANGVKDEIRSVVTRELGVTPGVAAARMAARLATAEELVALEPERGLALLSDMDGGDGPADVLRAMSAPIRTPDGSAHPDAPALGDEDGASLSIRSGDSHVAFDLSRTDDGGLLTIDSNEGRVHVQLVDGDDGGQLRIRTDDREVMASFGDDADGAPGWVAGLGDLPARAQPVISLESDRGRLGAVAWESGQDASEVLTSWAGALEAEGYEVEIEHRLRDGADEHGSLWARHRADRRMVFVVAHRESRGRAGVLVGYGEAQ